MFGKGLKVVNDSQTSLCQPPASLDPFSKDNSRERHPAMENSSDDLHLVDE